jgi:hypothetical protein
MTLPAHVNTREKSKFILLNNGSTAVAQHDRGEVLSLVTGLLTGVTYDKITAVSNGASTIRYVCNSGTTVAATIVYYYASEADWSLAKI